MGVVSTFGVDATVVQRYAGAYAKAVSTDTPVTTAMLTELIADAAAEVCDYLDDVGGPGYAAALAADTSTRVYRRMQAFIARITSVAFITAWEGGARHPEIVSARRAEVDAIWERYRTYISTLGDGRPTGENAPGLVRSHVTMRPSITEALKTAPLSARLAWKREV